MDHEATFCPIDIDCSSACERRSRSGSDTSSSGSSAATSDEKSSEEKNEDEEKKEKMASKFNEAGSGKKAVRKWPANRFIDDENIKVNAGLDILTLAEAVGAPPVADLPPFPNRMLHTDSLCLLECLFDAAYIYIVY